MFWRCWRRRIKQAEYAGELVRSKEQTIDSKTQTIEAQQIVLRSRLEAPEPDNHEQPLRLVTGRDP